MTDTPYQATNGPMITVTDLTKTYRGETPEPIHACDQITLTIDPGEIVALTGPSGSGKSTLLHLIGALDTPDQGHITVNGREVDQLKRRQLPAYRRTVGFVFQRFHLLATLTATDNVTAPLLPYKTGFNKQDKARQLLEAVGLAGREKALPSKLSGGQQQRVAIARALINDPPVLLADEPTGNLDSATGQEIIQLLQGLRDQLGTTMLIATHNPTLANNCDRTIHLRDGRLTNGSSRTP